MQVLDWLFIIILIAGVSLSAFLNKLTLLGSLIGGLLTILLYLGFGISGVIIMGAFFLLGTFATIHKLGIKQKRGVAEKSKGKRDFLQVISNGGTAGVLGLLAWLYPQYTNEFRIMMAATFSSATADTISSELGNIYGKKFYNIITLKRESRGIDGAISLEGSLSGLAGSIIIAIIYALSYGINVHFFWIIIAGTIGNLADSLLGATLQRRLLLSNSGVNLANTIIAACVAYLFIKLE